VIIRKSPAEVEKMRRAGCVVAEVLNSMRDWVRPGVTTKELDDRTEALILERGGIPSFKGYPPGSANPFEATICASINAELVHGIPNGRALCEGDIISVDVGVILDGYHGDAAVTLPVGEIDADARLLLEVTEGALEAGIAAARAGNRTGDISAAIQSYVEARDFNVVREYTGHGIGSRMHEDPQVPNHGRAGTGPVLRPGMTIALEPMVLAGDHSVEVADDRWTVISRDRKLTAHFEHTICVTKDDPQILTLP
jgi:methionyl aminopeptidase